jgi:hypothetical protein
MGVTRSCSEQGWGIGYLVAPIDELQIFVLPNLSILLLASPASWALLQEQGN